MGFLGSVSVNKREKDTTQRGIFDVAWNRGDSRHPVPETTTQVCWVTRVRRPGFCQYQQCS